jgi:hypothetical protein
MTTTIIPDIREFDEVKRHLTGAVLIPNRFDLHDEGLSVNEVEAACHFYNANHFGSCDINHTFDVECATVIESYILEADTVIGGFQHTAGTWISKIKIDHSLTGDVIWEAILDGELAGFSPEGAAFEHEILGEV